MRICLHYLVALGFAMLVASCSIIMPPRLSVDIVMRNDSTNDLNWVGVRWDNGEQTVGVLPPGVYAGLLDVGLPKSPKSDTAFMEFVDDKDGWIERGRPNSERKHYRIPVDVSTLKRLSSGHYCVTFSILSFTEAKLTIEKKDE